MWEFKKKKILKIFKSIPTFKIFLKIYIIKIAFFVKLVKDFLIHLFIIIINNIEKIFEKKIYLNLIIIIFEKYQNFFDIFFKKQIDKFFFYRFNNHKINFIFEKKSNFDFYYDIFQNELRILKKYLNDNFIKKFIRSNYLFAISPIFFI